jgi:hypothetical protein
LQLAVVFSFPQCAVLWYAQVRRGNRVVAINSKRKCTQ